MKNTETIIGVDEVGRGPLAGPVAVCATLFLPSFNMRCLAGVRDSKTLSDIQMNKWFAKVEKWKAEGLVRTAVVFATAQTIDELGLTKTISNLVAQSVKKVSPETKGVRVLLDGLLHAPREYTQETIIHGDSLKREISLASIVAKVTRDRLMVEYSKQFPEYGFEKHKGYGTKMHKEAIARHGLCDIHRRSFCSCIIAKDVV